MESGSIGTAAPISTRAGPSRVKGDQLSSGLLIQVEATRNREPGVLDAHHFRSQAQLYRELARRMSLRGDAEYCRIIAERCQARAIALETSSESPVALRDIPSSEIPNGG